MPLPLFMFCTLGCVVISLPFILLPLIFLLVWGIILTLWSWDCKIRMTICEIKTSVYHFAISTLQCSYLAANKSLSYTFISWFAFIYLFNFFSSTQFFSAIWKLAGQLRCLSSSSSWTQMLKVSERGTKAGIEIGLWSLGHAFAHVGSTLCSSPRSIHIHKWALGRAGKNMASLRAHLIIITCQHHLDYHIITSASVTEAKSALLPCP